MSLAELQKLVENNGYDTDGIDLNNKRRLIRLLENEGRKPTSSPMREDTIMFGIQVGRETLRDNVTLRVNKMFDQGLIEEVKQLSELYGWDVEPMKGIGYQSLENT